MNSNEKILTEEEKRVRKELTKIYPQLLINEEKVLGMGHSKFKGDLLATAVEMFLNKKIEDQIRTIENNKLENFITFIMNLQAKSNTTKFYKIHRGFTTRMRTFSADFGYDGKHTTYQANIEEDTQTKAQYRCLKREINNLDPFQKMVIEEAIIKEIPISKLTIKYRITYNAIKEAMNIAKSILTDKCKTC